jgi:hypothetical protein
MHRMIEIECVYCAKQNSPLIYDKEFNVVRCDEENGGCNRPLIIHQSEYLVANTTVYTALNDGYGNTYEAQKEGQSHHIARFGAFLLNKSIEAWKAGHHFDYSFHSILGYFNVVIQLGGWVEDKEPDLRLQDILMDDLAAIKQAEAAIEEVMQRKEAKNA